MLTERENALRVYNRTESPEWIPVCADCYAFIMPTSIRERPVPRGEDGADWFGCNWIWDADCLGYAPDLRKPLLLNDITKWRDVVKFPDISSVDWEASANRDLAEVDRNERIIRVMMESGPFERTHHILGFQNAFLSMCEEPEEFKALIDAIADYKVELINKICQYYAPDEIFAQDDLGGANGPMMSLTMYRELLKPAHKRIVEAVRSHGVVYTHHSCGKMEAFIEDLIDIGVQVINPMQTINNLVEVAQKYSDKLIFDVGADTAACYEDADEESIRQGVRHIVDIFGPQNNLILESFPSNNKCISNWDIVLDEARSYGREFYAGR